MWSSWTFVLIVFLSPLQLSGEIEGNDLQVNVISPQDGFIYPGGTPVFASIDVRLGQGPLSDAIRSEPSAFRLCITWSTSVNTQDDSDSVLCRGLLERSELPNLIPNAVSDLGDEHVFAAWLQGSFG